MNKNCPVCKSDNVGTESLSSGLAWLGKDLLSLASPIGIATKVYKTGKMAYYFFRPNVSDVYEHLVCNNCHNYIFECPGCHRYVAVGTTHPDIGDNYTCPFCKQEFVFAIEGRGSITG